MIVETRLPSLKQGVEVVTQWWYKCVVR